MTPKQTVYYHGRCAARGIYKEELIVYRNFKKISRTLIASIVMLLMVSSCTNMEDAQIPKTSKEKGQIIKVAVITGGHDFEQEEFLELFAGYEDIKYTHVPQRDHSEIFEDIGEWPYDVMVLYNMTQEISPKRQENFVKLLEAGVGVVALHHSIGAFQNWPEYKKIIGARFYLQDTVEKSVIHKTSEYRHDVSFTINIADKSHPIMRGLGDFVIGDETYKNCVFETDNYVLLTTDEDSSDASICWVRNYARAKVCYIQSGHGPSSYSNDNYRRLVARAIRWSAGKLN
ncbi:MAG: ThuA domain-containing protein [Sedimentisphaerales bacterium]